MRLFLLRKNMGRRMDIEEFIKSQDGLSEADIALIYMFNRYIEKDVIDA